MNPRAESRCLRRPATYIRGMAGKILAVGALMLALAFSARADDSTTNAAAAPATPPGPQKPATADQSSGLFIAPSNDVGIGSDGQVKDQDSYQVRIGELYAPGGEAYILPLRLPSLPAGQHIATAHIRFQLVGLSNEANGLAGADLYSLGVRDTNKALPGDYYQGSKSDPKATLLQANFLTPASKPRTDASTGPFIESSAAGDAALVKALDDAATNPANAGKYLLLRISYDADPIPAGNNGYMVLTTGATGDNEPPLVTYSLKK